MDGATRKPKRVSTFRIWRQYVELRAYFYAQGIRTARWNRKCPWQIELELLL